MKKLFLQAVFALLFLSVTAMAGAQWETTILTDNTGGSYSPQINDSGHVVWHSSGFNSEYFESDEILYYDGSVISKLTNNTFDDKKPQINASGQVVWLGYGGSDNGTDSEIFHYDGSTINQLTANTDDEEDAQINDSGYVVWVGDGGSDGGTDSEIFYYDGSTVRNDNRKLTHCDNRILTHLKL